MTVHFYPNQPIEQLENIIKKEDGSPLYGEIDVYRKLYNDLNSSKEVWHIWHDLTLPEHSPISNDYKKTEAQIDFLILCKHGVLVLEVKGGSISVKGNQYFYGKNYQNRMSQNPFVQAQGYKFTLKDNILNNIKSCFFCSAVSLPHVNYSFTSQLIDQNLLWTEYNSTDYSNSIECFILNVFRHEKRKQKLQSRTYTNLSERNIQSVIKILSPIIKDKNQFDSINTLKWLGIQNTEILDGLNKNPRIMIEGPPGSGKTTIAKAFIDRQVGKKGLYICWNSLLMHKIQNMLSERQHIDRLEVTTFFAFLKKINPHITHEKIISLDELGFRNLLKESIENKTNLEHYDYMVIDEAQDIFDRGLDDFIDYLCGDNNKGLSDGNSLILYDIDQSYVLNGRSVIEDADLFVELYNYAHFRLNEVKRSAQSPNIRKLSNLALDKPNILLEDKYKDEHTNIKINLHKTLEKAKKHLVQNVLNSIRMKESSLLGKDCIVLVESSLLKGEYNGQPDMHNELIIKDVEELTKSNINDTSNILRYTSILKYKGLESKNVFLVVTKPSEKNKYELFVGITRAICNVEINIIM